MLRTFRHALLGLLAVLALAHPAAAQPSMTPADVDRLQDAVTDAGRDIAALRATDALAARRLQSELDELQDEVIYLRVRLRKESSVPRTEYTSVRDGIEALRTRIRGGASAGAAEGADTRSPASPGTARGGAHVAVGTELDVRLQTALDSGTAQVEDRFEATTLVDVLVDDQVVIPAGSMVRGVVTAVKSAGRLERTGSLSLRFDQITVAGRSHPIRGTVTQAMEAGGYRDDAAKIGTGAAVGGVIGGILGGFEGALAGVLIGGGGTVAATEGQQVQLEPGTILRMRFDTALDLAK